MISRAILILPRLFLGIIFLVAVYFKWVSRNLPVQIGGFLSQTLPGATSVYRDFAHAVIVPHLPAVATPVLICETFVAFAMLLGVTTRLASAVAIFLLVNYMLAKGMALWLPGSNDAADIVIALIVGVGAAGRVWGIDAILAKRYPRVLLW